MADRVTSKIIENIKMAIYFAIIIDYTRDVHRIKQMSIIIRYVNILSGKIEERFLGFIPVEKTTGKDLSDYLLGKLKELDLDIKYCRGQGYDNGANMKGCNTGLQTQILKMNPLAFFTPCGCHNWNLLICDAASSCIKAKLFFGILQRLYTLFSAGNRWTILTDRVKLTLKPLSTTRWECRIESVKAVRYQLSEIIDALEELSRKTDDSLIASECDSLSEDLSSYEFIISLVTWHDILYNVNLISKIWQQEDIDLSITVEHLKAFTDWIKEYRLIGCESMLVTANSMAEEYNIPKVFKEVRRRGRRRQFNYESIDEIGSNPESLFKTEYFYVVCDQIIGS